MFSLISRKAVGPTDMFSNQTYLEIFFLSPWVNKNVNLRACLGKMIQGKALRREDV